MMPQRHLHMNGAMTASSELAADWRPVAGGPQGMTAAPGWDGSAGPGVCRTSVGYPAAAMNAATGAVHQRRQATFNGAIKTEYGPGRAMIPNGYMSNGPNGLDFVDGAPNGGVMAPMMTSRSSAQMTSVPAGAKYQAMNGGVCAPATPYHTQQMPQQICATPYGASGQHPTQPGASGHMPQQLMQRQGPGDMVQGAGGPAMMLDRVHAESGGRKLKERAAVAADYSHRMVPYPTPQQYMLNKRAKYSGNSSTPSEMVYGGGPAAQFDGTIMTPYSAARPLRHLSPSDYTQQPRVASQYPTAGNYNPVRHQQTFQNADGQQVYPMSGYQPSPVCNGMSFSGQPQQNYPLSPLPGNPTPPMTPGVCGGGGPAPFYQSPVDQKPVISELPTLSPMDRLERGGVCDEPRLTFLMRDGLIMAPFRLEHNLSISNLIFIMRSNIYQQVMSRPEFDVQLKSFHHEDRQMKTNWPASVSICVNTVPVDINRGDGKNQRPVYLKHVCQPGRNMLQIAVTNCCCSHLFIIQLVHRPTVKSAIHSVLSQRLVMADQSVAKIKRSFSQRSAMSAGQMQDDKMSISLMCPMSRRRIVLPARGIDCTHIQCFDLETYLRVNAERCIWMCPICDKPAMFEGLEVDQYVWGILQHLGNTQAMEVAVDQSASWRPVSGDAGGQWAKPVSPETMSLPTLNMWLTHNQWMPDQPSQSGTPMPTPGNMPGNYAGQQQQRMQENNLSWYPSGSPPDYIGCLSQMSNSFLPSTEDAPNTTVATSRPSGDHAASLPPTPVGSQLSGSQICTPLDGQSLHPRTPSDSAAPTISSSHPLPPTPQDSMHQKHDSPTTPSHAGTTSRRRSSLSALEGPSSDGDTPSDTAATTDNSCTSSENRTSGDAGMDPLINGAGTTSMQDALDMLPDNLDDPMDLLSYLGPGGQAGNDVSDCGDSDLLSFFS